MAADFSTKKELRIFPDGTHKQKNIKLKSTIKKSIYSLPEIAQKKVKNFDILACPDVNPTSILLPLIPLIHVKNQLNQRNIIIDF